MSGKKKSRDLIVDHLQLHFVRSPLNYSFLTFSRFLYILFYNWLNINTYV